MKKFIICVSLLFFVALRMLACGPFPNVHNYYMMKVVGNENPDLFYDRVKDFWNDYVGMAGDYFGDDCAMLMSAANRKGDEEMKAYIRLIAQYKNIAARRKVETWDYPTKQELAQQKVQIEQMRTAALKYKGQRLRPQYTLLLMRANLLDNRYPQNTAIWKNRGVTLKPSVFRDMCQNIYAASLLKAGQRKAACDIYARQGDFQSLQFAMLRFTHLDGIKSVYGEDAHSPALAWLVQNFVNSVQEDDDCERQFQQDAARSTYKSTARQFVRMALQVIHEGTNREPALWQAAIAMVHYTLGDVAAAEHESKIAMTMKGTQLERDNARCIHLLAYTKARISEKDTKAYSDYVTAELQWLDAKWRGADDKAAENSNYFANVYDRVLSQNIIAHYRGQGNQNMVALLTGILDSRNRIWNEAGHSYTPGYRRNFGNSEYFCQLDSMTSNQLKGYMTFLRHADDGNALQRYALHENTYRDKIYFDDLLATKLMAEGRFAEALPFLAEVPLAYVQHQGIAFYMARRDFHQSRWMKHQLVSDADFWPDEDFRDSTLTVNQKIAFCEEMNNLLGTYQIARQEVRPKLALQLASRYLQASCYGDCWYLTHYEKSVSDSARAWEKDFATEAMAYLEVARQDPALLQESLYAEAYVQMAVFSSGVWYAYEYDYNKAMSDLIVKRAYDPLAQYYLLHQDTAEPYITKCDLLQKYMHP